MPVWFFSPVLCVLPYAFSVPPYSYNVIYHGVVIYFAVCTVVVVSISLRYCVLLLLNLFYGHCLLSLLLLSLLLLLSSLSLFQSVQCSPWEQLHGRS